MKQGGRCERNIPLSACQSERGLNSEFPTLSMTEKMSKIFFGREEKPYFQNLWSKFISFNWRFYNMTFESVKSFISCLTPRGISYTKVVCLFFFFLELTQMRAISRHDSFWKDGEIFKPPYGNAMDIHQAGIVWLISCIF